MNRNQTLDFSWATILKIFITLFGFYILYLIRDILVLALFAFIISILFEPAINFFQRLKISRFLSTIFVYLGFLIIFASLIYFTAPIFLREIRQFTHLFSEYFERISPFLLGLGVGAFENLGHLSLAFQEWLIKAAADILSAIVLLFGGIFATITIFVLAIFISLEEKGIERAIGLLSPKEYENFFVGFWQRARNKVAGWFGVRILCCILVGLTVFLACYFFDVKHAAAFGFLAGVLDLIPLIGPIIAGILIVIFTAFDSWLKAGFLAIVLILIQQIEGNILIPFLTKKFMGLPPFLVLFSLIAGGKLFGVLGAILAIPLAGIIFEFVKEFSILKKEGGYTQE